jgi:hypothetical protein
MFRAKANFMNILALQGGGCLGYGQALTLAALEKRAGVPVASLFDVVAGTSVGAIIGCIVASGVTATTIVEFFTKYAPLIFPTGIEEDLAALTGPRYSAAPLEAALMNTLGERTLKDCPRRLIVPSYDFESDRIIRFDSGVSSGSDDTEIIFGRDSEVQLWQIARASSAAQTYFPAYEMAGLVCLDGGNTSDNAPDMLALTLAMADWQTRFMPGGIRMLSLGSGATKWNVNAKAMVSPSPIRAGLETIQLLFAAGEDAQTIKARKLLGPNYFRLQPDLGEGIAINDWAGCAEKIPPAIAAMLAANSATLDEFCPSRPTPDDPVEIQ